MVMTLMTNSPVGADEKRRRVSLLLQSVHGITRLHAEQKSFVDLGVGAVFLSSVNVSYPILLATSQDKRHHVRAMLK